MRSLIVLCVLGLCASLAPSSSASEEIVIGVHAPLTGANPFPTRSLHRALEVYWDVHDVGGRPVRVLFQDDETSPTVARDRCRKMIDAGAMVIVGVHVGNGDQVQACAQLASDRGVAYVGWPTTEIGMDLDGFVPVHASWRAQAERIWDVILQDPRMDPDDVTLYVTDSPNNDDTVEALEAAATAKGKRFDTVWMAKNPSQNDYFWAALRHSATNILLIPPTHYEQIANRTGSCRLLVAVCLPDPLADLLGAEPPRPRWIGFGVGAGLDAVLERGCARSRGIGNAVHLSPFPGMDLADDLAPGLRDAYEARHGEAPDHIALALWGMHEAVHELLDAAGPDPDRASVYAAAQDITLDTSVYPPVTVTDDDRFPDAPLRVLEADCTTETHRTVG